MQPRLILTFRSIQTQMIILSCLPWNISFATASTFEFEHSDYVPQHPAQVKVTNDISLLISQFYLLSGILGAETQVVRHKDDEALCVTAQSCY